MISDAKLVLEKTDEFGLSEGRVPTVSLGIPIAEPDVLRTMGKKQHEGVTVAVGNWGLKGEETLDGRAEEEIQAR